jgi:uncharacterized LabA/DUF88 family protein/cold shock CspA family protein
MISHGPFPDNNITRIGVFYDGGYFARVSNYYRFHDARKSRLSIMGLHEYVKIALEEFEGTNRRYYQITDAHYFRGRFSAYEASRKQNQLYNDRAFDDALMYANVTTHYIPMTHGRNNRPFITEKGIDVWFALECYELAVLRRYHTVVLVTGDRDHLPLMRKLLALGIRVMLLYWDVEFQEGLEDRPIRTSQALINEATYAVNMVTVLNDANRHDVAEKVFIVTDNDPYDEQRGTQQWDQASGPWNTAGGTWNNAESNVSETEMNFNALARSENTVTAEPVTNGVRLLGKIHHIDHANGHGYLHGINNMYDNLIFFRNARNTEEFNDLEKYDLVEFEVAQNAKGDYATNVRFNGEPNEN